jgi:hypothetical protein
MKTFFNALLQSLKIGFIFGSIILLIFFVFYFILMDDYGDADSNNFWVLMAGVVTGTVTLIISFFILVVKLLSIFQRSNMFEDNMES